MTPLQILPKIVRDLGKLIVAKGYKKLPKVQKIAQSGHTVVRMQQYILTIIYSASLARPFSKNINESLSCLRLGSKNAFLTSYFLLLCNKIVWGAFWNIREPVS